MSVEIAVPSEATAKVRDIFASKCPAARKRQNAIEATTQFNHNAPGRAISGAKPNNAAAARYPVAPPCPTDEYRNATPAIAANSRMSCTAVRSSIGG